MFIVSELYYSQISSLYLQVTSRIGGSSRSGNGSVATTNRGMYRTGPAPFVFASVWIPEGGTPLIKSPQLVRLIIFPGTSTEAEIVRQIVRVEACHSPGNGPDAIP